MDRPIRVALLLVLGVFGCLAADTPAQFQVLLAEDFEDGLQGWSITDVQAPPSPLWHLAEPGECGITVTRMAAYSLPDPSCTYAPAAGTVSSHLQSDVFSMSGNPPYHLEVDGIWGFDNGPVGNIAASTPYIENTVTGVLFALGTIQVAFKASPGSLVTASTDFTLPAGWAGAPVRLGFQGFSITDVPSTGSGMRYDNVLLRSSAYEKFGAGVPGHDPFSPKTPVLGGFGPLTPLSANELRLGTVLPATTAWLVFGLQQLDLPFKGGVMYPEPARLWSFYTGEGTFGAVLVPFTLPALPPGVDLSFQFWIQDPNAVAGWASSNGLRGTTS
jgi:hypothetical protein